MPAQLASVDMFRNSEHTDHASHAAVADRIHCRNLAMSALCIGPLALSGIPPLRLARLYGDVLLQLAACLPYVLHNRGLGFGCIDRRDELFSQRRARPARDDAGMGTEHCVEHPVRAGAGCAGRLIDWHHAAQRCAARLADSGRMDTWYVAGFQLILPCRRAQDHGTGRVSVTALSGSKL